MLISFCFGGLVKVTVCPGPCLQTLCVPPVPHVTAPPGQVSRRRLRRRHDLAQEKRAEPSSVSFSHLLPDHRAELPTPGAGGFHVCVPHQAPGHQSRGGRAVLHRWHSLAQPPSTPASWPLRSRSSVARGALLGEHCRAMGLGILAGQRREGGLLSLGRLCPSQRTLPTPTVSPAATST